MKFKIRNIYERKNKIFKELRRSTFSNNYLALDRVIKFLSYNSVRELDENFKGDKMDLNIDWLLEKAESLI